MTYERLESLEYFFKRENEFDYVSITGKLIGFIKNYKYNDIKIKYSDVKIKPKDNFGIHPFDLFVLGQYIKQNNIQSVLEFGAGTSSILFDSMGLKRKSFALTSMYCVCDFEAIDVYINPDRIVDYIKNNKIDLLFIDCEHSTAMAKFIIANFISLLSNVPIAVHDWFDYDKPIYNEQLVYYTDLIKTKKYSVELMTDLSGEFFNKLITVNPAIDYLDEMLIYKTAHNRCLAILKQIS